MVSTKHAPDGFPILSASSLSYRYPTGGGLEDVDLELQPGSILGVLGANGSGKSTLLRLLAGLLKPQRGQVLLGGQPLSNLGARERARRLALLSQAPQFDPMSTVLEAILLGRHPHLEGVMFESEADLAVARFWLQTLGLSSLESRLMGSLSGGERQRVALARVFAQETGILLLDEPAVALDIEHQVELFSLLREMAVKGKGILLVLHDLLRAAEVCTELLFLAKGRMVARGLSEDVLKPEILQRTFGFPLCMEPSRQYPGSWVLVWQKERLSQRKR